MEDARRRIRRALEKPLLEVRIVDRKLRPQLFELIEMYPQISDFIDEMIDIHREIVRLISEIDKVLYTINEDGKYYYQDPYRYALMNESRGDRIRRLEEERTSLRGLTGEDRERQIVRLRDLFIGEGERFEFEVTIEEDDRLLKHMNTLVERLDICRSESDNVIMADDDDNTDGAIINDYVNINRRLIKCVIVYIKNELYYIHYGTNKDQLLYDEELHNLPTHMSAIYHEVADPIITVGEYIRRDNSIYFTSDYERDNTVKYDITADTFTDNLRVDTMAVGGNTLQYVGRMYNILMRRKDYRLVDGKYHIYVSDTKLIDLDEHMQFLFSNGLPKSLQYLYTILPNRPGYAMVISKDTVFILYLVPQLVQIVYNYKFTDNVYNGDLYIMDDNIYVYTYKLNFNYHKHYSSNMNIDWYVFDNTLLKFNPLVQMQNMKMKKAFPIPGNKFAFVDARFYSGLSESEMIYVTDDKGKYLYKIDLPYTGPNSESVIQSYNNRYYYVLTQIHTYGGLSEHSMVLIDFNKI